MGLSGYKKQKTFSSAARRLLSARIARGHILRATTSQDRVCELLETENRRLNGRTVRRFFKDMDIFALFFLKPEWKWKVIDFGGETEHFTGAA